MKIAVIHSRVRAEEKLLFTALEQRGIGFDLLDDQEMIFDISSADPRTMEQYSQYDVIMERCINHGRALYSLRILNDRGIATVNTAQVADLGRLEGVVALLDEWTREALRGAGLPATALLGDPRLAALTSRGAPP